MAHRLPEYIDNVATVEFKWLLFFTIRDHFLQSYNIYR